MCLLDLGPNWNCSMCMSCFHKLMTSWLRATRETLEINYNTIVFFAFPLFCLFVICNQTVSAFWQNQNTVDISVRISVRFLGNKNNLIARILIGWWWSLWLLTVSRVSSLIGCSRWSHDLIEIWLGSGSQSKVSDVYVITTRDHTNLVLMFWPHTYSNRVFSGFYGT